MLTQENVYMLLGKVSEARKTCVQEGNYRPSKEQLAGHVGVSTEKLDKLLYNTRTPLSMQQPIWSDQDTTFQVTVFEDVLLTEQNRVITV